MSNQVDEHLAVERMETPVSRYESDDQKDLRYGYAWIVLFALAGLAILLIYLWGRG
jgi:hypothetical protein